MKCSNGKYVIILFLSTVFISMASAREYHVTLRGNDLHEGTAAKPLRTISSAAEQARPGDVITVHEGIYRERITPPRAGESDRKRIIYQAAPGERVVIKGSEVIKGWQKVQNDTWKVSVPSSIFGDYNPFGDLIGGNWFDPKGREHHTGAVYLNEHWLTEAARQDEVLKPIGKTPLWFALVNEEHTTIWAQFADVNPNEAEVEVNVRQAVFYTDKPEINYITVRGFTMMHAATPWAPPTAEQIGLIGTNWSKGWIIENNDIRYSICTGITLGKYGDQWDNASPDGYVGTIERALKNGWSKKNIGSHIVRNNHISHCEQAGLVGSLGAVFSTITGNVIHDIHIRQLFSGAEMAGIKIHGAIDVVIRGNHIYRTFLGIWLDWMAQGTHVTGNLLHDNTRDLFMEVNHGPFLVDNNVFLSIDGMWEDSQGGAYVHNLIAGSISVIHTDHRQTPSHKAHSTEVTGLYNNPSGDDRYYNNIFVNGGLQAYDPVSLPMFMAGNVYLHGAKASKHEKDPLVDMKFDTGIKIREDEGVLFLTIAMDKSWTQKQSRQIVTTELLGRAKSPDLPYEQPDGTSYRFDTDYFDHKRNPVNPFPGPFEFTEGGILKLKVWPKSGL